MNMGFDIPEFDMELGLLLQHKLGQQSQAGWFARAIGIAGFASWIDSKFTFSGIEKSGHAYCCGRSWHYSRRCECLSG